MGTKRHMADRVGRLIAGLGTTGALLDLFSGIGCVAESLADKKPVVTNDAMSFTAVFARARFTGCSRRWTAGEAISQIRPAYRDRLAELSAQNRTLLRAETRALSADWHALADYFANVQHVANNADVAKEASLSATSKGVDRYRLATLYFAGGYFSVRQAIQLDALRCSIDSLDIDSSTRDWLLSAWLAAAAAVVNAPGHTAQYLKPNTSAAAQRIRRYWRRAIWDEFQNRLIDLHHVGSADWRATNRVEVSEAIALLQSGSVEGVDAIYADPPYTKDQYSRYYHVYETLYRYDFPGAAGQGRARPDRFSTDFCLITRVVDAFTALFDVVADLKIPLVLSYPTSGLLDAAGSDIATLASTRLEILATDTFSAEHSTLGASQGTKTKGALENLYVLSAA